MFFKINRWLNVRALLCCSSLLLFFVALLCCSSLLPCVVHCLIYTLCLCISVSKGFNFYWALVVFVSHFPVDRYSLADKWLKLIEGRTLAGFLNYGHKNIPASIKGNHIGNYRILRGGFTSLVYCVVDNTFHLLLMLSGYKLLVKLGLM
jgi:hypothetical protein